MTEQPLSASPLQIERHEFLEIAVKASEQENPHDVLSLTFHRQWAQADKEPRRWRMELTIRFGGEKDGKESTYTGLLKVAGYFAVVEQYPEDKMAELIQITGASILYGACREMLANLTARGPRGMVSLPSVSFVPPPTASKSQKPAPKKALPKIPRATKL